MVENYVQNVPPAVLVRFLREHRSEWADFNVDAYSAASLKAGTYAYPGMRPTRFTGSQIIMPLGHTIEHEEVGLHSLKNWMKDAYLLWAKICLTYDIFTYYSVEYVSNLWSDLFGHL